MNSVKMTVNETNKKAHLEGVVSYEHPEAGLVTIRFDGVIPGVDEDGAFDPEGADASDLAIIVTASNYPGDDQIYTIGIGTGQWEAV